MYSTTARSSWAWPVALLAALALVAVACDASGPGSDDDTLSDTRPDQDTWQPDGDEGWCEWAQPLCYSDADCGRGGRCAAGRGELCIPSSTCFYPDGTVLTSPDCVPVCVTAVEPDSDGDGVPDRSDNCPLLWNPDQTDRDGNGLGDACEGSQVCETYEGCRSDADCNAEMYCAVGWECMPSQCCWDEATGEYWCTDDCLSRCEWRNDPDTDGDGVPDAKDNCPYVYNPEQYDSNGDGIGDACGGTWFCEENRAECFSDFDCPDFHICTYEGWSCLPSQCCFDQLTGESWCSDDCLPSCMPLEVFDRDGDGFPDPDDNCPDVFNPDQLDRDGDGLGDACDQEQCRMMPTCRSDADCGAGTCDLQACQPSQCCVDATGQELCTDDCNPTCVAGPDRDGDGVTDGVDNCPDAANPRQEDFDRDGTGDACDPSSCVFNRRCLDDSYCGPSQVCDQAACAPSTCCLSAGSLVCTSDCNAQCVVGPDRDGDGVTDAKDNCPAVRNPAQTDSDGDGIGDACSAP